MQKPNHYWQPIGVVVGVAALVFLAVRSLPPGCYSKDLQVTYLTARAIRDGIDPFTPIAGLAERYFPVVNPSSPLPNHLPPFLSVAFLPLTVLPYPVVALVWLAVNCALVLKIGGMQGLSKHARIALLAWPPALWVLDNGNYELAILYLAVLAWNSCKNGKDVRCGGLLGTAVAIKFYPAFFLIPFLMRKKYRVIFIAGLSFGLWQLGNLLAVGPAGLVQYYREILPRGSGLWIHLAINSSPYGALQRLFGGAEDIAPILQASGLAVPVAAFLSALAMLTLLWLDPEDAPLATMVALPNVRGYFAVLAFPAILKALRRREQWPLTVIACAGVSFILPLANLTTLVVRKAGGYGPGELSTLASLLIGIQAAGYIMLLLLVASLSLRQRLAESKSPARSRGKRTQIS